jgi:hypothetical protein
MRDKLVLSQRLCRCGDRCMFQEASHMRSNDIAMHEAALQAAKKVKAAQQAAATGSAATSKGSPGMSQTAKIAAGSVWALAAATFALVVSQ